jgi:hypothetical protein
MYVCMYVCMYGWMYGWMDGWMEVYPSCLTCRGIMRSFDRTLPPYQAMLRHVDFEIVKAVVLASPGYLKDDFYAFVMEDAVSK